MSHFLATDADPDGYRLETILAIIRDDVVRRAEKVVEDRRPEARHVIENDFRILALLAECIALAEDSTRTLDRAFGPAVPGEPRIGRA